MKKNQYKKKFSGSFKLRVFFILAAMVTASFGLYVFAQDEKAISVSNGVAKNKDLGTIPANNAKKLKNNFAPVINSPSLVGTNQGFEREPNDTFGTATPLSGAEGRITGNNFSFGTPATAGTDPDFYSFTTTVANSKIYVATQTSGAGGGANTVLDVFASNGTTILETDNDDGSLGATSSSIAGTILATPGTYYLRVTNGSTTAPITPYDLYYAVKSGTPVAETEVNDNGTPQPIAASQYMSGTISTTTDADTFTFNANAGDTVYLSVDLDPERDVTTFNGRIGLGLFGTPNNFLVVNDAGTGDTIDSEAMFLQIKTAGTYQVFIDGNATGSATSTYNFNLTTIPAATTANCTTYTNNTPTAIADLALTSSTINIPDSKIISSVRVTTDITHANYPDLDVHLRSPAGNDNGIYTDIGAAAQTGAQNLLLRDDAAIPPAFTILNGVIYKPELNYRLDWFRGENTLGAWTLDIRDDLTANTGTLNSWSMEVCEEAAPAGTLVYNENFEANNGGYTLTSPTGLTQSANEWAYGTPNEPATTTANPIAAFTTCASGVSCWKTDLTGTYEVSSAQDLSSPAIVLPPYPNTLRLYWQQKYQMESVSFDHAYARITEVGNAANTRVVWFANNATMTDAVGNPAVNIGASAGWGRYNADISDFAGRTVQVTFHVDSDTTINFPGLAIDDVQVYSIPSTAAPAVISGQVISAQGRGIGQARVTLTGAGGVSRTVLTNSFGYFKMSDVDSGATYVVNVAAKNYTFAPQVVPVTDNVSGLTFTAH